MKVIHPKLMYIVPLAIGMAMSSCSPKEQSPLDLYSIQISEDYIEFDENGGSKTIHFSTNSGWRLNTLSDWINFDSYESSSPSDNASVTITVPAWSQEDSERSATLSIKCGEIDTDAVVRKFITIHQTGPKAEERVPGIWTLKDLFDFGTAIASATADQEPDYSKWQDENGVINLWKDIDAGSECLPLMGGQTTANSSDGAFGGTFDGNGHTITGRLESNGNPLVALFTRLGPTGVIRNVNLDVQVSNNYEGSVQKHAAGLVAFSVSATTGYIENCTVKGSVEMIGSTTNPRAAGVIAYGRVNLDRCINYADIKANCTRVAGVCGAGGNAYTFSNCENYGNITVECAAVQVGGIIGQLNKQILAGCINYGNITATGGGSIIVGGLAGNSKGSGGAIGTQDSPCYNYGTITLNPCDKAVTSSAAVGGISGDVTEALLFSYCFNEGKVISNVDDANVSAGGITGNATNKVVISDCTNSADIIAAANCAGILGRSSKAATVRNCKNTGNIIALEGASLSPSFFGGIVGNGPSVQVENCINVGTVLSETENDQNSIGK